MSSGSAQGRQAGGQTLNQITDIESASAPDNTTSYLGEMTPERAVALLSSKLPFRDFFALLKKESTEHCHDVTTDVGRKAILAIDRRVAGFKTKIDDAGKKLNEEQQAAIKAVNAQRNAIKTQFETLQTEIKQPVLDWQAAEEARIVKATAIIDALARSTSLPIGTTAADIKARLDWLQTSKLNENVLRDRYGEAARMRDDVIPMLRQAHVAAIAAEAQATELAELRAFKAQKERAELEVKLTAERAVQRAADEAALVERQRAVAAQAEAAAAFAAERARARGAEQADIERAAAQARAESERKSIADAAEKAAAARRARLAAEAEIKSALMQEGGIDDEQAGDLLSALYAGTIPHVQMTLAA